MKADESVHAVTVVLVVRAPVPSESPMTIVTLSRPQRWARAESPAKARKAKRSVASLCDDAVEESAKRPKTKDEPMLDAMRPEEVTQRGKVQLQNTGEDEASRGGNSRRSWRSDIFINIPRLIHQLLMLSCYLQ